MQEDDDVAGMANNDPFPGVIYTAAIPWKEGSKVRTRVKIVCQRDVILIFHGRLINHKTWWKDDVMASVDGQEVLERGQTFEVPLEAKCKNGENTYFAKVTIQEKSLSKAYKYESTRVAIKC